MNETTASIDPVPASAFPTLQPVTTGLPPMPTAWSGVALLHPFSPPLSTDPTPDNPFFQLCVANFAYVAGKYFSAQIAGCSYGTWWYMITPEGTFLSTDQGQTFSPVDMGWSLPGDWIGAQIGNASCAGSSPLNWMPGPSVDWWKVPVHPVPGTPPAATWMWFDSSSAAPVRMMFGIGPPTPVMGDPTQLALFQMYSMTYMPVYETLAPPKPPGTWTAPDFPGFSVGNPQNFENFTWDSNFGMTAFMTPVNEEFNPLPTRVLYVWKADDAYAVATDRSQNSAMRYTYNQFSGQPIATQVALLTGPAPESMPNPPPTSDKGFLITYNDESAPTCIGGTDFPFPQEPPTWISEPAVDATICATISDNPVVSPGTTVTVFSVLFPPSQPNYPEATYLWTWYAPQDASGASSRPVTFMQSQSGVGVGTSLALADYFYYQAFEEPIDPSIFDVPDFCTI